MTARLLFLALLLLSAPASAQIVREDVPPPPAIAETPGDEPEVTIRNRGGDRYEEYRIRGQLYMIKVTPSVGPVYYLVARERDGAFERINDLDRAKMVTQWVLLRW